MTVGSDLPRLGGWRTSSLVTDTVTLSARAMRILVRNKGALLIPLTLPVMLMLMFVYLFGGAINTGTRYVTYVVPGILFLCTGFGSALTAVSVSRDLEGGVIDRFRSMDVGGIPLLAGHVAASVARNTAATALVIATALLIGFRPSGTLLAWLAALGVVLAFILAISWLSAAVGLLLTSPEAASGFTFFVMFLPYPSSTFVPIRTLPTWIRAFARDQPMTPIIETVRGLLLRQPLGDSPWHALAWCGGIMAVSIGLSGAIFARNS
jgi:ABC-2 type transport system permease protein